MKIKLKIKTSHFLADLETPVGIYLKVRDLFAQSVLLESSDYHSRENSYSIIGVQPLASYKVKDNKAYKIYPNKTEQIEKLSPDVSLVESFQTFINQFELEGETPKINGFLGYTAYSAVNYFIPDLHLKNASDETDIPHFFQILYRFLIVIDHLSNDLTLIENIPDGDNSEMESFKNLLTVNNIATFKFKKIGSEKTSLTEEEHKEMIDQGIRLCKSGELSQIVLSRKFSQQFEGDDFNVYRSLRSINPSPYLFYFDFGSFKIFGSSPETHCKIKDQKAYIDPIAGTYFRTGDDLKDQQLSEQLLQDEKEVEEHDMLVDFAKSDLLQNCEDVKIEFYKNIQFYSHVIHLVSRVSATIKRGTGTMKILADTFPAGTLVGSPKLKALKYIDQIEKESRGFYGGCIGYIGFDGNMSQAITIRSFLSKNNTLFYQAGGGIVSKSQLNNEVQEVKSKVGALKKAIDESDKSSNKLNEFDL